MPNFRATFLLPKIVFLQLDDACSGRGYVLIDREYRLVEGPLRRSLSQLVHIRQWVAHESHSGSALIRVVLSVYGRPME